MVMLERLGVCSPRSLLMTHYRRCWLPQPTQTLLLLQPVQGWNDAMKMGSWFGLVYRHAANGYRSIGADTLELCHRDQCSLLVDLCTAQS